MDYLNSDHPFFGVDNIKTALALIEARLLQETGTRTTFAANDRFVEEMLQAARDYPNLLVTADRTEGIAKLNNVLVGRAVRDLTETAEAGQYEAGNYLNRISRKTRREDDGLQDPDRQGSSVILAGNIYKKHNDQFQQDVLAMQNAYMSHPYNNRFRRAQPKDHLDSKFRDLI